MEIDEPTLVAFITTLPGLDTMRGPGAHYFFYDPDRDTPHDRRQPFATIVSTDDHDRASGLSRPGVFRLNVGVSRDTYRALFGPEPKWNREGGPVQTGHDFTALDTFLPHPVYAPLSWICILCPSDRNWPRVRELLREAHGVAMRDHEKRRRGSGGE